MNETVTIKEGSLTRRLAPVDKLKVNTTDNKDSMWVPTGNSNTGVLHASENGIYIASEDGYEAYSEVIVRVTKDSYEGDTSFDDWDYETPDMDLDNWDPETIEDFELDPDGFDDIFNNEDEWKDIDKPINIKMDNPKIQDTKISGIDPVTGNEMEVGLDADGYLTESTLPSSIKIEVLPSKLQYVEGQPIYLRGIIVKAYTEDGNLWTDSTHPDGIIQEEELEYDPTKAYYDKSGMSVVNLSRAGQHILTLKTTGWPIKRNYTKAYDGDAYLSLVSLSGYIQPMIIGLTPDSVAYKVKEGLYDEWIETSHAVVKGYNVSWGAGLNGEIEICDLSLFGEFDNYRDAANAIIEKVDSGDIQGQNTITVMYTRSDGEVLTDSYTIEVLPDPDGAHPQVDPSTVEWNHRRYRANEDLGAVEVRHGSVYMEGGAIYDVGAAVRLGMLEPVDNEIVP